MDLILDTSSMEFQACGPFKPRLDKDCFTVGQERWHEPAFAGKLVAWVESDTETMLVTVAAVEPPKVSQGQRVSVERLKRCLGFRTR